VSQPFFSIGVPTYNRHDLLRKTIDSILAQEFSDFEVIIGNDYTAETLTGEMIGISDPRVRIINHPQNLREVGNMNRLLELAEGRYFTWLFDDDLYEPDFLRIAHESILNTAYPQAFFSSFRTMHDDDNPQPTSFDSHAAEVMTGAEFIRRYEALNPYLISTCGLFETDTLKSLVGGVEELCTSSIGLYCEYLFLVRCAIFERIAHVDLPLVIFRIHQDSWGETNTELPKYLEAGVNLVKKCGDILRQSALQADLSANLTTICKIHLYSFATKSAMFEVGLKRFGISAAWGAISRYLRESRRIRNEFVLQNNGHALRDCLIFLSFDIYCCRFILFKLRYNWSKINRIGRNKDNIADAC